MADSYICKRCDRKKFPANYTVSTTEIAPGVPVTEGRLHKCRVLAHAAVERTPRDRIALLFYVLALASLIVGVCSFFIFEEVCGIFHFKFHMSSVIGCMVGCAVVCVASMGIANLLGRVRESTVTAMTKKIAIRLKQEQDAYEAFYRSQDWRILRAKVILEEGESKEEVYCGQCGKRIRRKRDITVDHIQPRSKHPHLSLTRDNLQVLCRRCNSSKGSRET